MIGAADGVPVYVEQVADVQIGDAFRVAVAGERDRRKRWAASIVARTGVNTKKVIDAVKARIAQIQPGLPEGVTHRAVLRPLRL